MNPKERMDSVTRDMDRPLGGIEELIELDIRRHCKGWGRFVLADSKGKPVRNAKLALKQTRHSRRSCSGISSASGSARRKWSRSSGGTCATKRPADRKTTTMPGSSARIWSRSPPTGRSTASSITNGIRNAPLPPMKTEWPTGTVFTAITIWKSPSGARKSSGKPLCPNTVAMSIVSQFNQ